YDSYTEAAKSLGIKPLKLAVVALRLREMLETFEREGGSFKHRSALRTPASKRIREMLADGETVGSIAKSLKLNKTEKRILDAYLVPETVPKVKVVAARIRIKIDAFSGALRTLCSKVLHGDRTTLARRRYIKLSDEEIETRVTATGATCKEDVYCKNSALYAEAKSRGVLDRLYGEYDPTRATVKELKKILPEVLKRFTLEQMLTFLFPRERDVLTKVVLAEYPVGPEYFKKTYKVKISSYPSLEAKVLGKLKELTGARTPLMITQIRIEILRIGETGMAELDLKPEERRLVRVRLSTDPRVYQNSQKFALKEGIRTRQGISLREAALLRKLRDVPTVEQTETT
ncbi:hypothetical protein HZC08_02455, partial [Candidatus Micrarchaeota archaeon]|nr:hypothetical protein [Candidatus Micrarchaeota archaeon]